MAGSRWALDLRWPFCQYIHIYNHSNPPLQPYSYNYHMYTWGWTQPYVTLHYYCICSEWTHFSHGNMSSQVYTHFSDRRYPAVNNWKYWPPIKIAKHYYRKAPSVFHSIIPLNPLIVTELKSETKWHTWWVSSNDDNAYHEYRTPMFNQANQSSQIESI